MASWADVQTHMRNSYKLQEDTPNMLSMVWRYDDGRSQKIIVRRYTAFEREMVEFKSAFGRKGDATAEELLRKNSEMPLATIAMARDVYMVVYNALIASLDLADLDFYLSRIAGVADTLEEQSSGGDVF